MGKRSEMESGNRATFGSLGKSQTGRPKPSSRHASGSKLRNASGAGNYGDSASPTKRQPNQSKGGAKMRVAPSNETEDSGDIKKSKDFKGLMSRLNKGRPS